jgi:redox-sensitive bicupin YhaK (pirin superfamily)
MSAGRGITHSEVNPSPDEPVRLVQMWVLPDRRGGEPGYQEADISESLATGTLVKVASGSDDTAPISIRQRNAELWAGHLPAGTTIDVPVAPHVHVFVATGEAALADHTLRRGDAVRLTDENAHTLRVARDGTDVLIWATA